MKRNSSKMQVWEWIAKRIIQQTQKMRWRKSSDIEDNQMADRDAPFHLMHWVQPAEVSASHSPTFSFQELFPWKTSMGWGANFYWINSPKQYIMKSLAFLQEQECNARDKKASSKKVWPPKPPGTQKKENWSISEDTVFLHTKCHLVEALLRENKNSLCFHPPDRWKRYIRRYQWNKQNVEGEAITRQTDYTVVITEKCCREFGHRHFHRS